MRPAPEPEPLELTPEEVENFYELERRSINDPSLANRIMETYREIRERRLATEEQNHQSMTVSPARERATMSSAVRLHQRRGY